MSKRSPPDAQRTLFALAELEEQRINLVREANAAWAAGRKGEARKLARQVVAVEKRREELLRG